MQTFTVFKNKYLTVYLVDFQNDSFIHVYSCFLKKKKKIVHFLFPLGRGSLHAQLIKIW